MEAEDDLMFHHYNITHHTSSNRRTPVKISYNKCLIIRYQRFGVSGKRGFIYVQGNMGATNEYLGEPGSKLTFWGTRGA